MLDIDDIIKDFQNSFYILDYEFLDVRFNDTSDPIIEMEIWKNDIYNIWERLTKYAANDHENIFYRYQTKDPEAEEYFLFMRPDSPLLSLWVENFKMVINDQDKGRPQETALYQNMLKILDGLKNWEAFNSNENKDHKQSTLPQQS